MTDIQVEIELEKIREQREQWHTKFIQDLEAIKLQREQWHDSFEQSARRDKWQRWFWAGTVVVACVAMIMTGLK